MQRNSICTNKKKFKIKMISVDHSVYKELFYEKKLSAERHLYKLSLKVDWCQFYKIELLDLSVYGIETLITSITQAMT